MYREALGTIFSEPPVDEVFEGDFVHGADDAVFSVEYLPGQFDQRADSAEQCVKLLKETEEPVIKTATTYVISGSLTKEELDAVKASASTRWTPGRHLKRSRKLWYPYLKSRRMWLCLKALLPWMRQP